MMRRQKKHHPPLQPNSPMKIVVRAPNWIGDSILALPAIRALYENFPDAELWICGQAWITDIFPPSDFIKGVLPLKNLSTLRGLFINAKLLRKKQFDMGLLLTNSFSSALLFYLANIPQRWGYNRDYRRKLLTRWVNIDEKNISIHQARYYINLLSGLGIPVSSGPLCFDLDPSIQQQVYDRLLSLGITFQRPLVCLNPGAFYGPAKRWPTSLFAELATLLQKRNQADIVIVGTKEERSLAQSIADQMETPPLILSGTTTVSQLAGVLHHSTLFVSNDSGPMHLANSLKVPVVAIFGPTDPQITGPYQQPSAVVKKDVDCWPCRYRECPTDHRCMETISAEDAFSACEGFMP